MLVARLLKHMVRTGSLEVVDATGRPHRFGDGADPEVVVRLHRKSLHWRLFIHPELALGEAYMDGALTIEKGSLYAFLDMMTKSVRTRGLHPFARALQGGARLARRLKQFNPIERARANVGHHYDLSDDLYNLFLDGDRQYSCAYFSDFEDSLEQAQENKKHRIAAKLLLEPGHLVLDIGSGWGGLAIYLAREYGVRVTGLTLSTEQLNVSRARARDASLDDRVKFELLDYREITGQFDRIVSVGMFEHVGINHYPTFFGKVAELLNDDGIALLHTIGRGDGPDMTDPWFQKYIFPGGYIPALSEVVPELERAGLWTTDVEVLRLHYAQTLRHWRKRFLANRAKAVALYDERFARMWEYYLVASEMSFRNLDNMVFQIQMAKRMDAVPLTRDYMSAPAETAERKRAAQSVA